MYINNIHILYYFFIGLLGIAVGQFMSWANQRLENHNPIICKEFFKVYLTNMKLNIGLMLTTAIIYIILLYFFGWSIDLLEFLILAPMFIAVFIIDYKKQIIPNRLTLTIFEVAIIFTFIGGISNLNLFLDKLLGMAVGGGIFLIITLIRRIDCGKRSYGLWRCKINGSIRINIWIYRNFNANSNCIFTCSNN